MAGLDIEDIKKKKITAILVKTIQDLSARIEKLEKK
jgi:hypothetical protein